MSTDTRPEQPLTPGAQRILDVASELFCWRGIHAVGVDTIAAESGAAKRTLYDRFGSKDNLVAAYIVSYAITNDMSAVTATRAGAKILVAGTLPGHLADRPSSR